MLGYRGKGLPLWSFVHIGRLARKTKPASSAARTYNGSGRRRDDHFWTPWRNPSHGAAHAESSVNGKARTTRRSDQFLAGLAEAESVAFVSHIQSDPDSLGSMLGLSYLVEVCLGKSTRLIRDGLISRAENRAMVQLLDFSMEPIEEVTWKPNEALVMVDSQPNTGRHSFGSDVPLYAVIDHHDTPGDVADIPFVDVRQGLGATCSVVTSYLMEQNIDLPQRVATGLLYGIETELAGYPREASSLDDSALLYLYPLADKDLIARIRNARLPQSYFECLLQALQVLSSTTALSSAGSMSCRSRNWRRRWSISSSASRKSTGRSVAECMAIK